MDPLILLSDWWWTAAVGIGGVTAGAYALRRRGSSSGRRIAYDAARLELKEARAAVVDKRSALKIARADHIHLAAERSARRVSPEQLASSKRMLRDAERDVKAAAAEVKAKQTRLSAARAAIPAASAPRPLDRLRAEHDHIVGRWMRYETDPGLQITYPAMTDVRQPATAAYLRASGQATEARRMAGDRPTPADYTAYRDAVAALARALDVAEHEARVQAGEEPAGPAWQDAAHDLITRSTEAIDKAAGAAASALAAWTAKKRPRRDDER